MDKINELESIINYSFKNKNLLTQALTHSSYANENETADNERMEFLGDSVLNFLCAKFLFNKLKDRGEGALTKLRAEIVSADGLYKCFERLSLRDFILFGKGEKNNKHSLHVYSGFVEALICAVYLDGGVTAAEKFCKRLLFDNVEMKDVEITIDYKGKLQEILHKNKMPPPVYKQTGIKGQTHQQIFEYEVKSGRKTLGKGSGTSKKRAEMEAAKNALSAF